jgi:hypothetical protein
MSICVKVPEHWKILLAALDAGKHVYCEWLLGPSGGGETRRGRRTRRGPVVLVYKTA